MKISPPHASALKPKHVSQDLEIILKLPENLIYLQFSHILPPADYRHIRGFLSFRQFYSLYAHTVVCPLVHSQTLVVLKASKAQQTSIL